MAQISVARRGPASAQSGCNRAVGGVLEMCRRGADIQGLFDVYRDTVRRGGLVSLIHTDFVGTLASKLVGSRYIDDLAAMARKYPLWNACA